MSDQPIIVPPPKRFGRYLSIAIVIALIVGSAWFAGFDPGRVLLNLSKGGRLLGRMFLSPDWAYLPRIVAPIAETMRMSIVGTFWGAVIALPVAVFAADNFICNPWIAQPLRFILNITRSIPPLVMASIFVAVFGIGAFSGALALAIFTFGLVSKLTFESIEAIDYGQVEALLAVGSDKASVLRYAIMPQILPQFMSYILYAFEINVRSAAVLGYVGAGGIGQIFEQNLALRYFDRVGVIILVSFAIVLVIDFISSAVRKRLV